ncbi:hypothetical protein ACOMHN_046333 [Nucella lapillus]
MPSGFPLTMESSGSLLTVMPSGSSANTLPAVNTPNLPQGSVDQSGNVEQSGPQTVLTSELSSSQTLAQLLPPVQAGVVPQAVAAPGRLEVSVEQSVIIDKSGQQPSTVEEPAAFPFKINIPSALSIISQAAKVQPLNIDLNAAALPPFSLTSDPVAKTSANDVMATGGNQSVGLVPSPIIVEAPAAQTSAEVEHEMPAHGSTQNETPILTPATTLVPSPSKIAPETTQVPEPNDQFLTRMETRTLLGQIRYLLEVNPLKHQAKQTNNFTQVTQRQLSKIGINHATPMMASVLSNSLNLLASSYGLTLPQPTPPPAEPVELPELGDPGSLAHFFPVNGTISQEHVMMLQELLGM